MQKNNLIILLYENETLLNSNSFTCGRNLGLYGGCFFFLSVCKIKVKEIMWYILLIFFLFMWAR